MINNLKIFESNVICLRKGECNDRFEISVVWMAKNINLKTKYKCILEFKKHNFKFNFC